MIMNILIVMSLLIMVSIYNYYFKTKKGKGDFGEKIITVINWINFKKPNYFSYNDVTLKLKDGTTTQIDHIMISKYGIFVIETKNMSGVITGKESDIQWKQKIGKKEYLFQNPIHQNYKHIKAIEELFEIPIFKINGLVVFTANAKFKKQPEKVFFPLEYTKHIKSFKSTILQTKDIENLCHRIEKLRLKRGSKTDELHIKNLNQRFQQKTH